MKNPFSLSQRSLIALVQLVFLIQIALGWMILPAIMTSGDSAVFPYIREDRVREMAITHHESNVRYSTRALVASGSIGFILITVVAFRRRKMTEQDTTY
jgi:hypothetical protein